MPSIQKTSELVQEIAAASAEQSESVVQIGGAMGQLSKATQQNASASEQLAATSEELSGQAEQLQQSVAFFNTVAEAVRENGMVTMATPFDEVSVDKCVEFDLQIIKIASSDIKDWVLIEKIANGSESELALRHLEKHTEQDFQGDLYLNQVLGLPLSECEAESLA